MRVVGNTNHILLMYLVEHMKNNHQLKCSSYPEIIPNVYSHVSRLKQNTLLAQAVSLSTRYREQMWAYCQGSLQFAGDSTEAVQHKVFSHAVDPLSSRRQRTAHKVSPLSLTRTEASHNLHYERILRTLDFTKKYNLKGKKTKLTSHKDWQVIERCVLNMNYYPCNTTIHRCTFNLSPAYLALHVHNDHSVGAVADYKMLRVLRKQDHIVHSDVRASGRSKRLERA